MNKNELITFGIVAAMVISAFTFWGYQGNQCKIEAIKNGMKSTEVRLACNQ